MIVVAYIVSPLMLFRWCWKFKNPNHLFFFELFTYICFFISYNGFVALETGSTQVIDCLTNELVFSYFNIISLEILFLRSYAQVTVTK